VEGRHGECACLSQWMTANLRFHSSLEFIIPWDMPPLRSGPRGFGWAGDFVLSAECSCGGTFLQRGADLEVECFAGAVGILGQFTDEDLEPVLEEHLAELEP